jgi:hypothetical protein
MSSSADDLHQDIASAIVLPESVTVSKEHEQVVDHENSLPLSEHEFSSAVYDSLSMGLDFSSGIPFAKSVH